MLPPPGAEPHLRKLTLINEGIDVNIDRAQVVAALRARNLADRADWVERQLPEQIDTAKNHALLDMLGIDITALPPIEVAPGQP